MKASKLTPSLSLGLGCLLLTLLPTLRSLSRAPQCPKSVGLAEEKGCTRTQPLRLLRQRLQGDQPELEDGAVRLVHNLSFPGPHILHVYQRAASELMQQAGSSWVSLQAKERFCGCLSRRPNAQVREGNLASMQLQLCTMPPLQLSLCAGGRKVQAGRCMMSQLHSAQTRVIMDPSSQQRQAAANARGSA